MNTGPVEASKRAVAVNARFRRQPITGVQRYAHEVTGRLGQRLRAIEPAFAVRGMAGHLWEQLILPGHVGEGVLLWSPANTGPLLVRNQVVTIHDLSVLDHPEWFSPRFAAWYRFLLPRLARNVRHILTISTYSKSRILERLSVPSNRVSVVPLGVGPEFRPAKERAGVGQSGCPDLPPNYLAVVGSLEPRKNLARVLDAWQQVRVRHRNARLVVVGSSSAIFRAPDIDKMAEGVQFVGQIAQDELPRIYGGAIGFIYASLYEGFGLPILEAMACGTPVICSNATSLPEVAGDAAVYVDPFDVESIANGILTVLEDGQVRGELRQKGLARAGGFRWEVTASKTWDILMRAAMPQAR
jgi:glycosyltransferase involved in cell wall biosynthesis